MGDNILLVKNMVCHRCVLAVEAILERLAIAFIEVRLGEVILGGKLPQHQKELVANQLIRIGFELMDNHKTILIEKIKTIIIARARNEHNEDRGGQKLSYLLSTRLHHEYSYLSSLFSSVEGKTIEKYFIDQRIEKIKELLVYDEMSLTQIAYLFDYSSTAYLSNQFKKVTGFNPSDFKTTYRDSRRSLSSI